MKKVILQVIIASLGLWLAALVVPGVSLQVLPTSNFFGLSLAYQWELFLLAGITLGLLNYFIRPVLNLITLPLRIITLGISSFLVEMFLIWIVTVLFEELTIPLFLPLFFTALIIWGLNLVLGQLVLPHHDE